MPLIFETHGGWGPEAQKLLKALVNDIHIQKGFRKDKTIMNLTRRVAVALWKSNARMVIERSVESHLCFNYQ